MRSQWEALRAGLMRSIETREGFAAFEDLRSRVKCFESFKTATELVAAISSNTDLDARDPVLRTLVHATHDRGVRRLAQALLLLCFWPALDAMFRRRVGLFLSRPQDLASEIVARFTIEVQRIDLRRVACLTATLLRNTERNLVRAHRCERMVAARATTVTPEVAVTLPPEPVASSFGLPANQADGDSIEALGEWLRRAIGKEADLVVEAVLKGKARSEIAVTLGISHAAARKRLERALARARAAFLADPRSQTGASIAFAN
jgi:DNA-directed RNA polymerase specialized sigma24 family protein